MSHMTSVRHAAVGPADVRAARLQEPSAPFWGGWRPPNGEMAGKVAMRVLMARAGKHSRQEYTVGAPLRVVTVTAGGARRIWPPTLPWPHISRRDRMPRYVGRRCSQGVSARRSAARVADAWQRGLLRLTLG